ncbi:MAG TPA: hypothetical protein VLG16_05555 [Candidatus Saccharimonadales bacterium]|nr:hypothetical protein [Candidatus Saccharimonadales bacterium]
MIDPNLPPEPVEQAEQPVFFDPFTQPLSQEQQPAEAPTDPNVIDDDLAALAGATHVPPKPTKVFKADAPQPVQPEQAPQATPAAAAERLGRIARLRARVGKVAAVSLIGAGVGGVVTVGAYVMDSHYQSQIRSIANNTYYHQGDQYKLGQENVETATNEKTANAILAGAGIVTSAALGVSALALTSAGRKQRREEAKNQPKLSRKERRQARRDGKFAKEAEKRGWAKSESKPGKPAEATSDGNSSSDSSEA